VGWQLWQLDQTSEDSVQRLIKRVADTYGRIDFLFLNAGKSCQLGYWCQVTLLLACKALAELNVREGNLPS
jgi:NAD(P)-dependent dehydrogenase (short-subunit alcohol dehydrogenase family)